MTTTILRKKLHGRIEAMPDEPPYIAEPASVDEIAMIDEGMAEYRADPSSFVPLESIK
jgi:hypothetical protein